MRLSSHGRLSWTLLPLGHMYPLHCSRWQLGGHNKHGVCGEFLAGSRKLEAGSLMALKCQHLMCNQLTAALLPRPTKLDRHLRGLDYATKILVLMQQPKIASRP